MYKILITNYSYFDKDHSETFINQDVYKFFSVNIKSSTLVPMYYDLLKGVLGDKMDEFFRDFELSKPQTEQIRTVFEKQIDETLPLRESKKPYNKRLEWKGEVYDLSLSLICPNNRRIRSYARIVEICDECLAENKPMYLSIEENPA